MKKLSKNPVKKLMGAVYYNDSYYRSQPVVANYDYDYQVDYPIPAHPVPAPQYTPPPIPTPPPATRLPYQGAFPMCCGISIIQDFPQDSEDAYNNINAIGNRVRELTSPSYTGMKLIALNHLQAGVYREMLETLGYREVAKAHHTGHGNDIHLFAYINNKPQHSP